MNRAVAALGLVAVVGAGALAWLALDDGAPAPREVVVDVTARRYEFEPGDVTVHVGDVVVFRVTSEDVTHGFAIEGLHGGVEIPPGETVEVRVRADRAGAFAIYCTVFCGAGHPAHKGTLTVVG